jgi:hypothetical protein
MQDVAPQARPTLRLQRSVCRRRADLLRVLLVV